MFLMHDYGKRLAQLRELLAADRLDGLVVTQPENRRYLSGYTGTDGTLFLSTDRALLITDLRFTEQASREAPRFEIVEALPSDLPGELNRLAAETGAHRVAFESHYVTVATLDSWVAAAEGYQLEPRQGLVEGLRSIKDEHELELIRRAAAIGDQAFNHFRGLLRPGMTEREAAWEIEAYMRTHGAEAAAFEIIVASGPNGAMAHATVSDRAIQEGEPIVIDLGARVEGYCSDLTRTLILGQPDRRFSEIYYLVLDAQMKALAGIKPGMTGHEADALARDVIEAGGYGHLFGHGLGHSVGLAVHEDPKASKQSTEVLRPAMTLTVEPGIYITGWGGVRIEDLVVLTDERIQVVSKAGKGPVVAV
jgi:Xaa-Pro aminopeptidase